MRMIGAENIRDWRNHDVVDPDGHKIGQLEAIYVDTGTDEPALFAHYGIPYQQGSSGERRLARR
jgi:hypothetical protein